MAVSTASVPELVKKRPGVLFERRDLIQFLAQADPILVIKIRRDMQEFFRGALHCLYNPGVVRAPL